VKGEGRRARGEREEENAKKMNRSNSTYEILNLERRRHLNSCTNELLKPET